MAAFLCHLDTVDQLSFMSVTVTLNSQKFLSCVLHTNAVLMMSKNFPYLLVLNQIIIFTTKHVMTAWNTAI